MQIRTAEPRDLPAIDALVLASAASLDEDSRVRVKTTLDVIRFAVERGGPIFLAEDEGGLTGVCAWVGYPGRPDYVTAAGTFVHPDHAREGIGTELRLTAEEFWAQHGAKRLLASVAKDNVASIESLRALGFETTGYEMTKTIGGSDGE